MNETPQQYIERIHRTLGDRKPLESMQQMIAELQSVKRHISDPRFRTSPEGKWSGAEILSHLAEGELVYGWRLRTMLADSGTNIPGFDQNVWVTNAKYLQSMPDLSLDLFLTLRKANLALLRSLAPEKWNAFGIHSERGHESIADLTKMAAGHDINHLKQLQAIVAEL
jgi:hypothetical protein